MIVIPASSGHWYTREGKSFHTVPKKDGNGDRPTTVKDARELKLLPSVTSILSCISKPQLTAWLQQQAVLASLTLPKIEGESLDEFAKRAVEDASEQSKKAATFGTAIHAEIEKLHLGQINFNVELWPYIEGYKTWFDENVAEVLHAEIVLVNKWVGYAGTCDLIYRHKKGYTGILDAKTQGIKDKPRVYPEWLLQLMAYSEAYCSHEVSLQSVVIDSTKPGKPFVHDWPVSDHEQAWEAFKAAHSLWCWQKNYYP